MNNDDRRLIEEYLPIAVISEQSDREKKAGRAYHISTLHMWWARRPLASARAAVLASLVPASAFPADRKEIADLFEVVTRWQGNEVGLDPLALEEARRLIRESWPDDPPKIIDTFAGGGAILLEAIRLGCEAAGTELNPVAFMVATATLVWPQQYGSGLADDLERWGKWVKDKTFVDVEDLYPSIPSDDEDAVGRSKRKRQVSFEDEGSTADLAPVAYLWTRTVPCPNPARSAHRAPLIRAKYVVRKDRKRIALKVVPAADETARYELSEDSTTPRSERRGRSSASSCRICGAVLTPEYLAEQGRKGEIGFELVAVISVRPGRQGKSYMSGSALGSSILPDEDVLVKRLGVLAEEELVPPDDDIQPMGNAGLASGNTYLYGIKTFSDVFTKRQLVTLLTLCKYVRAAHEEMVREGMDRERADVITAYLGLAVNRVVDRCTALCRWNLTGEKAESPFVRDRLAMVWDFVEVNPFAGISGDFTSAIDYGAKVIRHCARTGRPVDLRRGSATDLSGFEDGSFDAAIVDPPYYDNISYAALSDFFYVWLRRTVGGIYPDLFNTVLVPKGPELTAAPERFEGDKQKAKEHFESGFRQAFTALREKMDPRFPLTVYYAFKQADEESGGDYEDPEGTPSVDLTTGWETLLEALIASEFQITATWPVRASQAWRMRAMGSNALASYIVLACRPRPSDAPRTDRRSFVAELKRELPGALRHLQQGNIAPVDFAQAAIGPGMGIYSRYREILESSGRAMSVRTALHLINETLTEVLSEQEDEFDSDTRWAISWFEEHGFDEGVYGEAEVLSKAKVTSVDGLKKAGLVRSHGGKVRLLRPVELQEDWDSRADKRFTIWEATHHLVRVYFHEQAGDEVTATLLREIGTRGEIARDLAYRLFDICERKKRSQEAQAYNALVLGWPEIARLARSATPEQGGLFGKMEG